MTESQRKAALEALDILYDYAHAYADVSHQHQALGSLIEKRETIRADLAEKPAIDAIDAAYKERNQVVAALAKCFPSGIAKTAIDGWDEAWHNCVYIDLPTGQASWHYHDRDAHLFEGLPPYTRQWDGHSTPEKCERLHAIKTAPDAVEVREAQSYLVWHDGQPPKYISQEWFIAKLKDGKRAVLKALPEMYAHQYKTADETYYTKDWVIKWMQFPDSDYIPYCAAQNSVKQNPDGHTQPVLQPVGELQEAIDRALGKVEYEIKPFSGYQLQKEDLDIIIRAAEEATALQHILNESIKNCDELCDEVNKLRAAQSQK